MKRRSVRRFSGTLEIPHISKTLPGTINSRKVKKQPVQHKPVPPSEEMVKRLNNIGREYPFCVYFKYGSHDLL